MSNRLGGNKNILPFPRYDSFKALSTVMIVEVV